MSQTSPPKGKINRAPKDSEFDQAILIFAAALGIALVSIWVVWSNGESAATSYMLKQNRAQAEGKVLTYKIEEVDYVLAYEYTDPSGNLWSRVKTNNAYLIRKIIKASKRRKKKVKSEEERKKEFEKNTSTSTIPVFYHPEYPRFFATKGELPGFEFNFRLTIGGLVALLLAIVLGLRSIRKYRRMKAIAAYY